MLAPLYGNPGCASAITNNVRFFDILSLWCHVGVRQESLLHCGVILWWSCSTSCPGMNGTLWLDKSCYGVPFVQSEGKFVTIAHPGIYQPTLLPVFLFIFHVLPLSTVMAEKKITTRSNCCQAGKLFHCGVLLESGKKNYFTVVSCWGQAGKFISLWCLVGVRLENLFHCGVTLWWSCNTSRPGMIPTPWLILGAGLYIWMGVGGCCEVTPHLPPPQWAKRGGQPILFNC